MTDPKAIDISPEAVGAVLDDMRSGQNELDAMGLISALSVALSEARGKVGEAAIWEKDQRTMLTAEFNARKAAEAERDAALSELAKLRAEAEWRPIAGLPDDVRVASGVEGDLILLHNHANYDTILAFWGSVASCGGLGWHTAESVKPWQDKHFDCYKLVRLPSPPKDPAK